MKKVLLVYTGLYALFLLYAVVMNVIQGMQTSSFPIVPILSSLALLCIPWVAYRELNGHKVFVVLTILAFLIALLMAVGPVTMDGYTWITISKSVALIVMPAILITFAFKRIFKKKA